jgi:hypothetical protein
MDNFKKIAEQVLSGELKGAFVLRNGIRFSSDGFTRCHITQDGINYEYHFCGCGFLNEDGTTGFPKDPDRDIVSFIPQKEGKQTVFKLKNDIDDFTLANVMQRALTKFSVNKSKSEQSVYFSVHGFKIRLSDHLSKNTDAKIQIVPIEDKILFFKSGEWANKEEVNNNQYGIIQKFVTKEELLDILTIMNNAVQYFVP